jgi:chromosome transmission fidelity protein 1
MKKSRLSSLRFGRLLVNACAVVPGGVVVFFPSFKYADDVYARWVKTGAMGQLSKHKSVFREPRTAAKVEKVLRDFAVAVRNVRNEWNSASTAAGTTPTTAGGEGGTYTDRECHSRAAGGFAGSAKASRAGAVMLCVCGGKLSEGINFKDELGRLVVMVGLPYANPEEPELRARMQHLDASEAAARVGASNHASTPALPAQTHSRQQQTRGRAYYEVGFKEYYLGF